MSVLLVCFVALCVAQTHTQQAKIQIPMGLNVCRIIAGNSYDFTFRFHSILSILSELATFTFGLSEGALKCREGGWLYLLAFGESKSRQMQEAVELQLVLSTAVWHKYLAISGSSLFPYNSVERIENTFFGRCRR